MNRLERDLLPPTAYKTYTIALPLATHWRAATCEEVDCPAWLGGWKTIVPTESPQAAYIRRDSGRGFKEEGQPGGLSEFTFWPGQRCFKAGEHRVQNGRPEHYFERGGDHRGNPGGRVVEHTAAGWVDSFGENQERLSEAQERG